MASWAFLCLIILIILVEKRENFAGKREGSSEFSFKTLFLRAIHSLPVQKRAQLVGANTEVSNTTPQKQSITEQ